VQKIDIFWAKKGNEEGDKEKIARIEPKEKKAIFGQSIEIRKDIEICRKINK
jgi:hypothetical protein